MAITKVDHSYKGGEPTDSQAASMFFDDPTFCAVCGSAILHGERAWYYAFGPETIFAHADCIKQHARGIILDMAKLL